MAIASGPRLRLAVADRLLHNPDLIADGAWPRACTWLIRLALEHALVDYWQRRRSEVAAVSRRAQLLTLTRTVDPDLGQSCTQLWHTLSRAAHHHAYELSPTSTELRGGIAACTAPPPTWPSAELGSTPQRRIPIRDSNWYSEFMTVQITVRLPDELVAFLDRSVAAGQAASRAAVVANAVEREMRRQAAQQDAAILRAQGAADDLDDLVRWSAAHAVVED